MQISGATALVTGANRGLGAQFVTQLLDRGAARVYAAVRDPATVTDPRVTALRLDVTDAASIAAAAEQARDVTLVVNNAGIGSATSVLGDAAELRRLMDVNYFGLLAVSRAFAPVLAANDGGALVNMLSVASWHTVSFLGAYSATKAAAWSATNALRLELAAQHTQVTGVHVGFVDTDLTAGIELPKLVPAEVVAAALDGIELGSPEVVVDEASRAAKAALAKGIEDAYPELAAR